MDGSFVSFCHIFHCFQQIFHFFLRHPDGLDVVAHHSAEVLRFRLLGYKHESLHRCRTPCLGRKAKEIGTWLTDSIGRLDAFGSSQCRYGCVSCSIHYLLACHRSNFPSFFCMIDGCHLYIHHQFDTCFLKHFKRVMNIRGKGWRSLDMFICIGRWLMIVEKRSGCVFYTSTSLIFIPRVPSPWQRWHDLRPIRPTS